MAHIAIVGPGAVGGVVAAWLGETHRHEVVLCARRTIGELTVETVDGRTLMLRSKVVTDPSAAPSVDWVLIATKAYDATAAAAWLPRLIASGAPIAVLQNGVEHRDRFSPFVASDRIVPVMVDCPAERSSPTQIRQRGRAKMVVSDDDQGRAFAALFTGTEIDVSLTNDFKTAVWRKLCVNAVGAISALLLKPAGVMRDERLAEVARGLVRECIAVGRAEGAVLDDSLIDSVLSGYRAAPVDAINSLHADRAAGRPMEVDARNGVIVRLGRKHAIATPYNEMAVALLQVGTAP
ncbi:MAG: 2-dehydropantoate 2-reductase [Opitutus sp.]